MLRIGPAWRRRAVIVAVLIVSASPTVAYGQAAVPVHGRGPIPETPYTSWSLFLMCNPEWLSTKKAPALEEVFNAYVAFARTSGSQHAAVWFVRPNGVWQNPTDLDVERSVEYCQKFGLVPSEGPHVVVLTTHPDKWKPDEAASASPDSSVAVLKLGGSETRDIATLIFKLNDQIVTEKLSEKALTSEQYWLSWIRVFERACRLLDKVKFTVTARFVKIEKEGVCT